ncbi:MAG: CoA-binding protein [Candidatus Aenigmatarchaeota archaeon]
MTIQNEEIDILKIKEILSSSKTIAIIGLSDKEYRPSYQVAKYLLENNYEIIPVNPNLTSWNGIKAYKSISEIPIKVDIADYFINSENVFPLVEEALSLSLERRPRVIWLQEGILCNKCYELAKQKNTPIIMNHCIMKMHYKLFKKS